MAASRLRRSGNPAIAKLDPVFVLQVEDKAANPWRNTAAGRTGRGTGADVPLDNVLSDNGRGLHFGSYERLTLPSRPVAAKTGTTNMWLDAWTMGYTPQLAVGVWTNWRQQTWPTARLPLRPSSTVCWPKVWRGCPRRGGSGRPAWCGCKVCVPSGLLPTPDCPSTTSGLFLADEAPVMQDNVLQAFEINSENGKRASACTPPELIQRVVWNCRPPQRITCVRRKSRSRRWRWTGRAAAACGRRCRHR